MYAASDTFWPISEKYFRVKLSINSKKYSGLVVVVGYSWLGDWEFESQCQIQDGNLSQSFDVKTVLEN